MSAQVKKIQTLTMSVSRTLIRHLHIESQGFGPIRGWHVENKKKNAVNCFALNKFGKKRFWRPSKSML